MSSYEKNEGLNSLISLNYSIIKRKKKIYLYIKLSSKDKLGKQRIQRWLGTLHDGVQFIKKKGY